MHIRDVPVLVPGEEEALIRISTAGVCHSDLHLARGDWFGVQLEAIGHEAIGVVEALGHISRSGPLSDLPAILDELEAGTYLGRAVLEIAPQVGRW